MEIKQQLQMYLQTGNSISIAKVERELSFETILKIERVAKFCQLTKEQEKNILTHIHMLSDRFFKVNFPDANTSEVASQFAVDILETRPDWTLYDVIYFFKFSDCSFIFPTGRQERGCYFFRSFTLFITFSFSSSLKAESLSKIALSWQPKI